MLIRRSFLSGFFFFLMSVFLVAQTKVDGDSKESVPIAVNENASEQNGVSTPEANSQGDSFYDDPSNKRVEDVSYTYFFIKTLIILLIFSFMAYALTRFLKKRLKSSVVSGGPIEVLYRFPMGVGRSLEVLKVVNDLLLVSNTQEGLHLISKIEDKEAIDLFKLERDKQDVKSNALFGDIFSKYTKVGTGSVFEITKNLKERLEKMRKK